MQISFKEKLAYGLGDFASNLIFATVSTFLMYYYTDIYGLQAVTVGTILFVARFIDALWDIYLGTLIDRTKTRWGQCRPYLLFASPVLALCAIATFTVPPGSDAFKIAYAYITYTLLMCTYSLVNIPYIAMPALLTDDPRDRTRLSAVRMFCAILGSMVVGLLTLKLVAVLGGSDKAAGYQSTVALMAGVGVLLFWVSFLFTKERVAPVKQDVETKKDFMTLIHGRAWWMMALMGICVYTALSITGGSVLYYFKYVVGDQSKASLYLFVVGLGILCGILIAVALTKKLCKRKVMIGSATVSGLLYLCFYFIDPKNIAMVYAMGFFIQVFNGISVPILWSMVADTSDDAELRSGRRMVGLATSSIAFSYKFGLGLGGALAGFLLAFIGYQANVTQTPETIHGLIVIMSVIPALSKVGVVVILWFYPLDQAALDDMQPRLKAMREQAKPAPA
ncbi:MAG: MFS transporter [Betaproteobacteria bacterium]|nr:MAG: MFS transporter [Betaproteobacteria bacterium]